MPLRIALLTSEITLWSKTGGLADVTGALAKHLALAGHDVRVFTPLYSSIDRALFGLPPPATGVLTSSMPGCAATVHFIDDPALLARAGLYTEDADEHRRFIALTRAAFETCRRTGFAPRSSIATIGTPPSARCCCARSSRRIRCSPPHADAGHGDVPAAGGAVLRSHRRRPAELAIDDAAYRARGPLLRAVGLPASAAPAVPRRADEQPPERCPRRGADARRQRHHRPAGQGACRPGLRRRRTLTAELDLSLVPMGKMDFDVVGHYARPDVFALQVDTAARHAVKLAGG